MNSINTNYNIMKKIIALLFCLLPYVQVFAQNNNDDFALLKDNEETDFHPIFNSINEMVGKNVSFAKVNYKEQIKYVFTKRGKRLVSFNGVILPFEKNQSYYVEDIITDKVGEEYIQLFDKKNNKSIFLRSPYSKYWCNTLYDVDEVQRMKDYCKKNFVYRLVEAGETPIGQPFDYLPYVEVGISNVDVFPLKYGDGFTVAFYYFTEGKERFVEYDMIKYSTYKFLSDEGLIKADKEYQEKIKVKLDKLAENTKKYGIKIAIAIYNGGLWTEEMIDKLINLYGIEEVEYVVSSEVHIGMSKDLCELSWGKPDKINKTTYSFGVKEQWVYREKNAYLYFEDDKLTAFTENE